MLEQFKFVSFGADSTPTLFKSYYYHVLDVLKKHWAPMLIFSVCKGKRGIKKVNEGVYFYCIPSLFHYILLALALKSKVKSKAVVSQDPFFYGMVGLIVKGKGVKHFVSLHSDVFFNKRWATQRWRNKIMLFLGWKVLEKADYIRVVFPSPLLKTKFKDKYLFLPSNYVKVDRFSPFNNKRKWDIAFVGRLHHQKNIDYLSKLFDKYLAHYSTRKGVIVGGGDKKEKIKIYNLIRKRKNLEYIDFTTKVEDIYKQVKVVVITSYAEGGPRAAFEALASGCIVFVSPTGYIKHILKKEKACGDFVSFNVERDAKVLETLVEEWEKRQKKCRKNVVKDLKWEEGIERYAKEYLKRL